ncbi:Piso0_004828 [Millerozyma farinosa CBS 7064]|uniref:Piso0_004828 protein n=1 Tax=Pichia sorbitophila (strain ATCC MYA-4447 / BCRC 22081 / CBS 7064 / NBRC 10061 / NRRL Y-12695) TaxID=559304 RepID=G8Y0J1_PICSO|nr:Piso0_004828 [Millerozyma farinosa CBS 7064]
MSAIMDSSNNPNRKRSEASLRAAEHWRNKKRKPDVPAKEAGDSKDQAIIVASSDDDAAGDSSSSSVEVVKTGNSVKESSSKIGKVKKSPIQLLYDASADLEPEKMNKERNYNAVTLSDMIGMSDLQSSFQFNFAIDLEFFLEHVDRSKKSKTITFVLGSDLLSPEVKDEVQKRYGVDASDIKVDLPKRFGTHHTKMMVNFYEDGTCEIIIMTCNLQPIDFSALTQMCWRSGRLSKASSSNAGQNRFKTDIIRYLKRYRKPKINELADTLAKFDMSGIDVELVASVPGNFNLARATDESEEYGYGKLYQVLKRNDLLLGNEDTDKEYNVLAQATSISYPFALKEKNTASVFSHIICPLVFSRNSERLFDVLEPGTKSFRDHQIKHSYNPHIIYPCAKDIALSGTGFYSGQAIHFKYDTSAIHRNQYEQNIKPYLYKWRASHKNAGRDETPPHVKLYMCDNGDNWKTLRWVLMASHNLSKQAWGARRELRYRSADPSAYEISSYELGVLIPSKSDHKLVPVFDSSHQQEVSEQGDVPVRIPFILPPERYSSDDKPWSAYSNYGSLKDKFGNTWEGLT